MDKTGYAQPTLEKLISKLPIREKALECKWSLRCDSKITAPLWCLAFCLASASDGASLRLAAFIAGMKSGLTLSKQAIDDRLKNGGEKLMQSLLSSAFAMKSRNAKTFRLKAFSRVIIQDSTCLPLAAKLREAFPGSANKCGSSATMRIQAFYDVNQERFLKMSIGSFRENDQGASAQADQVAGKGDLLIRDLGYFSLSAFKSLIQSGIALLTRLRIDTHIFNTDSQEKIDLLKTLRRYGRVDMPVLVGAKEKLPMRLVAYPVPEKVANERRRKLKANRDKRLNPSKETLALQNWQIFLTTASGQELPTSSIGELYEVRWRIEILFKSWKSSMNVGAFQSRASEQMVRALTYASLLRVVLMHSGIMPSLQNSLAEGSAAISVLKLASLIAVMERLEDVGSIDEEVILENLQAHSLYEKRKRRNLTEKWQALWKYNSGTNPPKEN